MAANSKSQKSQARLAKQVAECIKLLGKVRSTFGENSPSLSTAQRLRLPKPRPNAATVVQTVAALVEEHGLVLPKHSASGMKANLETVQTLAPLHASAVLVLKMIEDALFVANGGMWASATAYYTVLRRVEGADPNLAKQLEPVAQSFAKRSTKAKKPSNGSSAPQPAPANSAEPVGHAASSMVN